MPTSKSVPLILVPTQFELTILQRCESIQRLSRFPVELCGFGAIVSAARSAELLRVHQPSHVVLLGIAGALSNQLDVGAAYEFGEVACFGIGVGSGDDFLPAQNVGWHQWQSDDPDVVIGDTISLGQNGAMQLLTCTAASDGDHDVERRKRFFPEAMAEDMEGFSVAAACRLQHVKLSIVRGISNRAGDRDKSNWEIESALQSALNRVLQLLDGESL